MTKLTERHLGPSTKTTTHCEGCPALVTKDWSFECEDDETDRGTDAKCTATDPARHIASYWNSWDHAPDWCPARNALASGDLS